LKKTTRYTLSALALALLMLAAYAATTRAQTSTKASRLAVKKSNIAQPVSADPVVTGTGTTGQLTKWTSLNTVGDSVITETKSGNVGIGTILPASRLTVQGMIETTLGGVKFPDGTVQTTASIPSIIHDRTLEGDGVAGSPLSIAVPLTLHIADNKPTPILVTFGSVGINQNGGSGGNFVGGAASNGNGGTGATLVGGGASGAGRKGGTALVALNGGGSNGATAGLAGDFSGDVHISGNLSKGGGSFKIDHPLDPENKYLYHSFVESPDMKNIYDGIIRLDASGEAVITLPDWFGALNRDFRYLLTPIGAPAPSLFIAEKITGNRFRIAGGQPGMEVSWQVTGIRQDAYANKNRIPVEEDKPEAERGFYLHPAAFDQPEDKNVLVVQQPEVMRQVKEAREKGRIVNASASQDKGGKR